MLTPPTPQAVPADKNGAAMDPKRTPLDDLADQLAAAKAEAEAEANEPLTIADVAAAAMTALSTLVAILPPDEAQSVIDEYETRATEFKTAFMAQTADTAEEL